MICSNCGANCADTSKHCPLCGYALTDPNAVFGSNDQGQQESVYMGAETTVPNDQPNTGANAGSAAQTNPYDANAGAAQNNAYQNNAYNQNAYQNQGYGQTPYQQPVYNNNYYSYDPGNLTEESLPDNLKPLSPWAYLGYSLLFSMVPCAGLILAFVFAFSKGENVNKRNFARYYLLTLAISLVISIIMVIIFAALGISLSNAYGGYY